MNQLLRTSLIVLCSISTSFIGFAQQSVSVFTWYSTGLNCPTPVTDSTWIWGDATNYNSSTDNVFLTISWGDGTFTLDTITLLEGGIIDSFYVYTGHTYNSAGLFHRQIIATMPNGISDTATDSILIHNNCVQISGTVYDDVNSNCALDAGDQGLKGFTVFAHNSSGTFIGAGQTDSSGQYEFSLPPSLTGVSISTGIYNYDYYSTTCPTSGGYTINTSTSQTLDFGTECTQSTFDQKVYHSISGVDPPGDTGFISVVAGIRGCANLNQTDTVKLELSPLVSYAGSRSGPAPDLVVGNTLYWYHSQNNSPIAQLRASVYIYTLTTTTIFSTACFTVSTTALNGDISPNNNTDYWCLEVGGPYDPNDKAATPAGTGQQGFISNGERLTYKIRFQNTGTAEAKNVYILDTISDKLNIESMRIEAASHNMIPYFNDDRQIRFDFPKIYLIDSNTNEPESHGFVIYSIELADSFAPGTQIENTAYIFFDYNAPIVTNTVLNTIEYPTPPDSLNVSFDKRNVTCLDNDNGYVQALVTGGIPPFAYTWSNGETTDRIEKLAPGTYGLTVMDSMNDTVSGSEIVAENRTLEGPLVDSILGTVNAQAFKTYFYSIDPTIGHSYEWDAIGGEVTGSAANEASILWYAGPTGTILLDQYDENGCLGQRNQEVPILFVGIGDDPSAAIKVYPNPAKNLLTILRPEAKQSTARLYDVGGRLVFERSLNAIEEAVNVTSISSGAYNLRIEEGNSVVTFPVMIRH